MWLGRCACGRDIIVPRGLLEAIVRVRMFFRAQRLGPRPFRHPGHWAYALIGLMIGIFTGIAIGVSKPSVEAPQRYVGEFMTAKRFNSMATRLGCPQVDAVDTELMRDVMKRLRRCLHDRNAARGDSP